MNNLDPKKYFPGLHFKQIKNKNYNNKIKMCLSRRQAAWTTFAQKSKLTSYQRNCGYKDTLFASSVKIHNIYLIKTCFFSHSLHFIALIHSYADVLVISFLDAVWSDSALCLHAFTIADIWSFGKFDWVMFIFLFCI